MLIMLRRTLTAGIRLVIMLAMTLGVLPVSNAVSTSHHPLAIQLSEAGQHSMLSGIATAEHTHFDEEKSPAPWEPGHDHRHNPADHAHDYPGPAFIPDVVWLDFVQEWPPSSRFLPYTAPASPIERPPRPLVVSS
jgi:hypothetical protein